MTPKIDGGRSRAPIPRVDVQALAGQVVERLEQAVGQDPTETLPGILLELVERRELQKELSHRTLAGVAPHRGSQATDEAAVWLPADLPVVLAAAFLAQQGAPGAQVTVGSETWFISRVALDQEVGRMRSSFVRRSSRLLKVSLAPLWEGAQSARLGMGKVFDGAVDRLASGVLYYRCRNEPKDCFPSGTVMHRCPRCGGPVDRVSGC